MRRLRAAMGCSPPAGSIRKCSSSSTVPAIARCDSVSPHAYRTASTPGAADAGVRLQCANGSCRTAPRNPAARPSPPRRRLCPSPLSIVAGNMRLPAAAIVRATGLHRGQTGCDRRSRRGGERALRYGPLHLRQLSLRFSSRDRSANLHDHLPGDGGPRRYRRAHRDRGHRRSRHLEGSRRPPTPSSPAACRTTTAPANSTAAPSSACWKR